MVSLCVPSAVVVFAFILCWLPFHVGRYLFSKSFEPGSLEIAQISQYCNLVSFVLFYLSAAINPILYNIMSKKYRVAVFKLLGFESFSQRKLSTLKDESSRAWTKSSINTWHRSASLRHRSLLHTRSHSQAGLGRRQNVSLGIRDKWIWKQLGVGSRARWAGSVQIDLFVRPPEHSCAAPAHLCLWFCEFAFGASDSFAARRREGRRAGNGRPSWCVTLNSICFSHHNRSDMRFQTAT